MQQKKAKSGRRAAGAGRKRALNRGSKQKSVAKGKAPTLNYRDRVPADDAYILQLTEGQLAAVHERAFGEPFPREQFMNYVQSGAPVTVIEYGGNRIGYYTYLIGQDGKMHISAMVIDKQYQSKGIGTAVMTRVEQEAMTKGVHILEVYVQANNEQSLGFTRQLGFVEVFRVPPNTICFQKRLSATGSVPAGRPLL